MDKAHLLHQIRSMAFAHSEFYQRIDLLLLNPAEKQPFGPPIAAFYPGEALLVYSHAESLSPERTRHLLQGALKEFQALDAGPVWTRRTDKSYRTYLAENNQLLLTQRRRSRTLAKYRGDDKFSNAFKPSKVTTDETALRLVAVT